MSSANFDLGFDFEENEEEEETSSRFGSKTKKQQDDLMEERFKDNTKRATRNAINTLREYLKEKKLDTLENISNEDLPEILLSFYSNLKKVKGGDYKLQTLKCLRAGINRYMKEERNLDIIKDLSFTRTNEMFKAVSTHARKSGLGSTRSTPPIERDDLARCAEYFWHDMMNNPDPRKLQKCVLFNIIYYFCRRGRQNIHGFTQDMFAIDCDPDGRRYVYQSKDELDKNHGINEDLPANDGRMYKQPGSSVCPVDMFDMYTKKLNKDLPFFWQRPKRGKLHYTDPIWYDRIHVGHDPIENFMAKLSIDAKLSKRYTNHSIRSTVMGLLGELYEGRKVIGLSGHKNESTVKQYIRHLPASTKREMSDSLAENVQPPAKIAPKEKKFHFKPKEACATVSKPPEGPVEENNIQFDLQALDDAPPDDYLIKFLNQFDPVSEDPPQNPAPIPQVLQPVATNNISNISNVNNVQNVANQRAVPNMFFGGNSTVTINYNFGPQQ